MTDPELHHENPALDCFSRITHEAVAILGLTDYFDRGSSPACVAILPFVEPHHVGVEIGVFHGHSSVLFMKHCAHMFFIDPCENYEENPDKDWFCPEKAFLKVMAPHTGRFHFLKGFSSAVYHLVPDVDFVFIDGNHEYAYVKTDIELYWPKIKPGGFLCGHDYSGGHPGVTQAVDEFFGAIGLPVEAHQYCWLVKKPL